ncbi:23S rRNA (cytidine(2498)-2'-O)-methyltransferase RlmM [Chitinilyticum piscinae]|uniref:23S rRNA (Cytidine(2498)-2'-O)-methyltransferase RlmM n=1 Tax=Chitinilyticum piscinae TaxID=2866724 RepID=A0A8J7K291_9NEIS|nr:23S rRNA (cytidine(2498)-2'-O)-methyltransferase RlmM [Chitinilyticum piscinae]MBE9609712.1 23S rRNA (cytidine(2498)-2'-O)-methyltransferase RlmM [Chitinilyticum piscinae]
MTTVLLPPPSGFLAYCRPGFEAEALADLQARHGKQGGQDSAAGWVWQARSPKSSDDEGSWNNSFVFIRQHLPTLGRIALPERDRLTPIIDFLKGYSPVFHEIWIEYPDTNEGKALSSFAKKFQPYVEKAARAQGWLQAHGNGPLIRLHLFFASQNEVFVGLRIARPGDWLCGIPRLRFPSEAPSRSTLKLFEAFITLVDEPERRLKPGMTGVDLGAAPGGWTYQLVHRGLKVYAIDNGPMKGSMDGHPQVKHLREDGFRWKPRQPVDWLVCDMVEQPVRIAALIAQWLASGLARQTVFNLKLPMKKRHTEVERCLQLIRDALDDAGLRYRIRARHLYHDREEITCYIRVGKD